MKLELKHLDNDTWVATTPSGTEHTIGQSANDKFYIKSDTARISDLKGRLNY